MTAQLPSRRGMTRQARRTFTKHDPPFRAAGGRFSQESAPPKRLRCRLTPAQSPRNVPGRAVRQRGHGLVELTRLNQGDCDSCVHDVASSDSFSSRLHGTGALPGPRARRSGQIEARFSGLSPFRRRTRDCAASHRRGTIPTWCAVNDESWKLAAGPASRGKTTPADAQGVRLTHTGTLVRGRSRRAGFWGQDLARRKGNYPPDYACRRGLSTGILGGRGDREVRSRRRSNTGSAQGGS